MARSKVKRGGALRSTKRNAIQDINGDGWENELTGLGTARDKKSGATFAGGELLDDETINSLYRSEGLSTNIIDIPAEEILKGGFSIKEDPDGKITKYLSKINGIPLIVDLERWARGFGGSIMIVGAIDGGSLESELKEDKIKTIKYLKVLDRATVDKKKFPVTDKKSERYGEPEFYLIGGDNGYKVHYTRVIEQIGKKIAPSADNETGFGDSVLNSVYSALKSFGSMFSHSESIIDDFVLNIMKVEDLANIIAGGNGKWLKDRLDIMDMGRDIINTVMIGDGEEITKQSSSVSGVDTILNVAIQLITGKARIPARILFGQQSGGLNNEGKGETRDFYDRLESEREFRITPVLNRLIHLIAKAEDSDVSTDLDFSIEYPSLWTLSDKEVAEINKLDSETHKNNITNGIVTSAEARNTKGIKKLYQIED